MSHISLMPDLKWFLIYKVAEVIGGATAVALFMIGAGGIEPKMILMSSLGIGLVMATVDELIGGVYPSAPRD
jgi:hypothetical protein